MVAAKKDGTDKKACRYDDLLMIQRAFAGFESEIRSQGSRSVISLFSVHRAPSPSPGMRKKGHASVIGSKRDLAPERRARYMDRTSSLRIADGRLIYRFQGFIL